MTSNSVQEQATVGPVKVLLLGHSYVRCLTDYAGQSSSTNNMGL